MALLILKLQRVAAQEREFQRVAQKSRCVIGDMATRSTHRRVLRLFAIIVLILPMMTLRTVVHAEAVPEHQVKAAFLYNFAKFVEWPSHALEGNLGTFAFCVFNDDLLLAALKESLQGKAILNRKLTARDITDIGDRKMCHVLYIGPSTIAYGMPIRDLVNRSGTLTVSKIGAESHHAAIINFYEEEERLRFEINIDAAERAGLKISSKLLKLGKIVKD